MFLQLAHTKLNVYRFSQAMALECYKVTRQFPNDEKFAMVQQIRTNTFKLLSGMLKENTHD